MSQESRTIGTWKRVPSGRPSGHVFRVDRARGPVWYAKYRLPDGRQVQRKIGPAWTERGRPAAGYFTKRTAEAWLRDLLDDAPVGTLDRRGRAADHRDLRRRGGGVAALHRAGSSAQAVDRRRVRVDRAHPAPARRSAPCRSRRSRPRRSTPGSLGPAARSARVANRSCCSTASSGARARSGAASQPDRRRREAPLQRSGDIEVFSPEEVWALARAAGVRARRRDVS